MDINFDFDFNQTKSFIKWLRNNKIDILNFTKNGPAGGNPNITIHINNFNQHLLFLKYFYNKE